MDAGSVAARLIRVEGETERLSNAFRTQHLAQIRLKKQEHEENSKQDLEREHLAEGLAELKAAFEQTKEEHRLQIWQLESQVAVLQGQVQRLQNAPPSLQLDRKESADSVQGLSDRELRAAEAHERAAAKKKRGLIGLHRAPRVSAKGAAALARPPIMARNESAQGQGGADAARVAFRRRGGANRQSVGQGGAFR